MSRHDVRPGGRPVGDDADVRVVGTDRAVARADVAPSAARGGHAPRPFGGLGWREPTGPGPIGEEIDVEGDDEGAEDGGEGPRRRRAREAPAHPRRTLPALGAAVRVVRDEFGVPHVSARSERDAWAGLGWCMAEDRRMHLDLLRRLAQGRAAEILGPALVPHDALVRTVGVARRAALAASRLPGAAHDVLACFAAGVNASFAGPAEAAPPVEPWTIADSLAIEVLRAFATSLHTWPAKLLRAHALAASGAKRAEWVAGEALPGATDAARLRAWNMLDLGIADLVAGLPIDFGLEGTAWASTGEEGAEIGAVLHASPGLPAAYYAVHLDSPTLRMAGCVPVGVPALHFGRTSELAWAGVPAIVDDSDVVLEEIDGIGNRRTPSGWEKLSSRRETIRVRDAAPVAIEVLETRRGPLVSHLARQLAGEAADPRIPAVALHWGAGTVFSSVSAWLGIARATDAGSAGRALEAFGRSTQPVCVVVADRAGRSAAATAGCIPARDDASRLPLLGWVGEGGWTGVRPAHAARAWRPQESPGLVAVCGEAGSAEPGHPEGCRRLERIAALERAVCGGGTARPMRGEVDPVLARFLPSLRAAIAASDDPGASALAAGLESFDGAIRPGDRIAAIALVALFHFLPADLFPLPGFGPLASFPRAAAPAVERILSAIESPWFPDPGARDRAMASALLRAAAWIDRTEATSGRGAIEAFLRVPGDDAATSFGLEGLHVEGGSVCGSPGGLSMVDWRGATPPFAIGLAPTLRASCILAGPGVRLSVRGGTSAVAGHPHARDQVAGFASGDLHAVDLVAPVPGDILDLVPGS